MNKSHDNRHVVDNLFVLTLFAVFAICAVFIIAFGANIYKKTVNNLEEHFNLTTSVAYIREKFRQNDSSNAFCVASFGDGNALLINTEVNDINYQTYIYKDSGYIKELSVKEGSNVAPKAGQNLLPIDDMIVNNLGNNQYGFRIIDTNGNVREFVCTSKCD